VETSCEGSKIKHLYWRHFSEFEIPLPSRQEQMRIVGLFQTVERAEDSAISHVKETRQLQTKLLAKLLDAPRHV
jgi:restriction endonuclease S subunit